MASRERKRRAGAAAGALLLAACLAGAGLPSAALAGAGSPSAADAPPRRVVSINACTDQLLWALADREQIAGLMAFAADDAYSLAPKDVKASGVPLIRGGAEEALKLRPDLVLAGAFTRAVTRERLRNFGVRVETFAPAESIAEARADILRAARLLGREARGIALIAEIDAALAEAQAAARAGNLRLLQLQRAGYVSGRETLFDDVLAALGAANALADAGTRQSALEAVLRLKPDALVIFGAPGRPADQGAALLLHPALAAVYPPERRILLPGNLVICGGPSLPELLRALAAEISRVSAALGERD